MKNKPNRHKETNTFQFKRFSERVSEIDVDVFHRVSHRNEEDDDETETYFHQTLQKWNFRNLTEGYCAFKREVRNVVTLPQLLNQKQFVVDTLIEYLNKRDILFLQPILELVVAVAKDLQKEFYQYFPRFLEVIIDLLRSKDAELIEYTFTSLAYLFKFLWRYLVKHIRTVFDLLLPLLSSSRPSYVNSFAAESFAFVVRKVKDKGSFLKTVLNILESDPGSVPGCGKLLFEVISGTPGQLHSCAEQLLSLYFSALNDESVNQRLAYDVLREIVDSVVQNVHPQKCAVLWSVFLSALDASIDKTKQSQPAADREKSLVLLMRLLHVIVDYKSGKLVTDAVPLVGKLVQTMATFSNDNDVLQETINVAVAILLAPNVKLTQETSSRMLLKIVSVHDVKLLYGAVESLIHYSSFETLVLPYILRHTVSAGFDDDILQLLAKIVKAKAPPSLGGVNFAKWNKYIFDVRGMKAEHADYLLKALKALSGGEITASVLEVLIILPHLKPLPEEFRDVLKEGILSIYQRIFHHVETDNASKLCFTFLLALEAAFRVSEPEALHNFFSERNVSVLDLAGKYANDKFILNAVDLSMTYFATSNCRREYINLAVFEALHGSVGHNLGSAFSEVRLTVAHLYSLFATVEGIASTVTSTGKNIVEIMYLAESEPVTVQSYRERLLHLQNLVYDGSLVSGLSSKYHEFPLRYLMGNLFLNFSLLWEPVSKIIASYATNECEKFWPIFLDELTRSHETGFEHQPSFDCELISELEAAVEESKDKPDYENYRILLWKCMGHFAHFCEAKNRDVTGLFISFVNDNFFKSNSEDAKCCSIFKTQEINGADDVMEVETAEDVSDEEEKDKQEKKTSGAMESEETLTSRGNYKNNVMEVETSENVSDEDEKDETDEKNKQEKKTPTNAMESKETLTSKGNYKNNVMEVETSENVSDEDEKDETDEKNKQEKKTPRNAIESKETLTSRRNSKIKFLIAQLQIFEKVSNPRSLYREPEMRKIYLDLLSSKNPEIQKAALNCLLAYKFKYLVPYKENLLSLINEKNLKNELARFKIDKESKMIVEEHRDELIPILMRILFAKMITKTGMRTGGKAGGIVRRKMILRFLAGTQENEMIIFTKMAFKPFKKYMPMELSEKVNLSELTDKIINTIDLDNVIPPKRLQSAVNLLGIIIEQFGSRMASRLLPYLLGLVICILAEVAGILQKSEQVHPGFLSAIKTVRTSCISIIARFFEHYEDYDWSEHEINALFHVAVFPWLEKLPVEGIHSPTALLKLFLAWSQNSRYYPLFIKHRPDDKSVTPLPFVMRLFLGPKTQPSVQNAILEMIEKMVTLQDYGKANELTATDMEIDTPFLPLPLTTDLLEVDQEALSNGVNYGSTILLPHVFSILQYIKRKLEKSTRGVSRTELVILSRTSEFVADPDACDTLLALILPILVRKASMGEGEETIIGLLTTVTNLIKNVRRPEIHVRAITPLLGTISAVPARKLLIQLYATVAERSGEDCRPTLTRSSRLLAELNAWDQRWVDQSDFQRRLDAFAEIRTMSEKSEISVEFCVCVIYNCFYFLKHETDLALRDCAGQCLKLVGPKLALERKDDASDRRYLLDETILVLVRRGIASKNEAVRLQSISFLGRMAMECPEVHPVFRDLSPLANKADPEVDFFENLQHLQMHRKARALLKFCTTAKTLKKLPNPRTLTQFILPLASTYLCNESFIHKNSIVDAAIETVGTVCRLLPWHQYEIVLKYYLGKLRNFIEFQKQLVRIIVAILDAFHFDLSRHKTTELKIEAATGREEEKGETVVEQGNEEEELDAALSTENIENVEEVVEKAGENLQEDVLVIEKQILLSQNGARRVIHGISNGLLPQLHRCIIARTRHENTHKVNKKKSAAENEEEELMRVPIALAFVKLLQKLPERILDSNLPGIFMKLCTFLKSRLESVRRVTREILQKIMITLGPKYLHHLIREMNTLLTKGFQVHVLAFTVQSVLVALKPYFQKLDINQNLQSILSVCKVDLFGPTAEEKEVMGIVKNVSEAKSTKSFDIFHILAEFITESCLLDLILPLKEVLVKTHSHKTVQKIIECLRNVVLGLADNTFIPVEQMLIFLYGIVSESIPELLPEKKSKQLTEKEVEALAREKPDCFIIPAEPKSRTGVKALSKTAKNTNAHVIVEFGLKLCHILLKRDKISGAEFKPYLEPFVPLLSDCLKSQHVKLSTLSLQCLNWLLKMDLVSVRESISEVCSSIFKILHKYAAAGLSKGDNFDLVMASFKCMSAIVRDVKHFMINTDQLKVLIVYAEQDLHDGDRQATAFTLLKAIILRKMIVPEMHPVMEKVAALSVTSELEHVRVQSRSVFYSYLMEYPIGKHLEKHVMFYLTQLGYELQPGRLSALEMVHSMITGFPLKTLIQKSGLIFVMAGTRLVNDDDPTCRKLCAKCIKEMITRVPHNERSKLFDIVAEWLKDSKTMHRALAAQLCGIFVTVEKETFESRLKELLPVLLKQFHAKFDDREEPGRFVKARTKDQNIDRETRSNIKDPERMKDHHLFQVFQLLLKISAHCSAFLKSEEYKESVDLFADYSQSLLAHPHIWVRLGATQMIGFILAALDVEKIVELLNSPTKRQTETGYMYSDPENTLRSLSLDLIAQLQPDATFEDLTDQAVKNLIFIARILKSIKTSSAATTEEDTEVKIKDVNLLSLPWLVRRLRKAVNIEITRAPKSTSVRTAVFKWIAGAVATISIEDLNIVLFNIMSPLVREISATEVKDTALRRLAKEATVMIKKRLGDEQYVKLLSKVQQKLDIRKSERRKVRAQQFVTDPELAAKRKIARQQRKKEAKKRKLDSMKGKKITRKRPRKEVDFDVV